MNKFRFLSGDVPTLRSIGIRALVELAESPRAGRPDMMSLHVQHPTSENAGIMLAVNELTLSESGMIMYPDPNDSSTVLWETVAKMIMRPEYGAELLLRHDGEFYPILGAELWIENGTQEFIDILMWTRPVRSERPVWGDGPRAMSWRMIKRSL